MARAPVVNLNLRIPPELHKTLADLAGKQKPKQSLNNFIIEILYRAIIDSGLEELHRRDPERAKAKVEAWIERIEGLEGRVAEIEKKVVGE